MNVSDKWMLEQMQQMAASMAASLPQTGQNAEAPRTNKGESFQDLMNKAKDQQADAPKQEGSTPAKKTENVQSEKPVQKTENAPQQSGQPEKTSGMYSFDNTIAALVAADFVTVDKVYEDGTVDITMDTADVGGIMVNTPLLEENGPLMEVKITTGDGDQITIKPEQLQKVFEEFDLEGPQESENAAKLAGQIDPSKFAGQKVITPDGKVTTLHEAVAEAKAESGGSDEADDSLSAEVMTASQPLFKDVKAAPVKVGENFELDTRRPDMEQVLVDMVRYAAQPGVKEVEIMLNPANLGALTIKVTQNSDGIMQVVFQTTTEKAANLLNQHLDGLKELLQGYNQNEVRLEVQHNGDSRQADQQQQQQTDPDGHNRQQQEQQRRQEEADHSGDFIQRLRLGLFDLDDSV